MRRAHQATLHRNPINKIGFGDIHGTEPYKYIGFGDIHGPKPHKLMFSQDTNNPGWNDETIQMMSSIAVKPLGPILNLVLVFCYFGQVFDQGWHPDPFKRVKLEK